MIESISVVTVIGLALYLAILIAKWWSQKNDKNEKAKNETDKEIDKASNATDFLRLFDKLRGK